MLNKFGQILFLALLTNCMVNCKTIKAQELDKNYNEEILGQIT